MGLFRKSGYSHLMAGAAVGALTLGANAAWAQTKPITIEPQALASALHDFGAQTGRQIMFTPESAASKMSHGVNGATDEEVALAELLDGTGLTFRREANIFLITRASDPQSGSAAGDGADGTVQALIVTAQKREEDIQDVPIAISAFTQESLERSQIAGGPDLMTQVPNMTFTKTNFASYSIQLRGIGTQAISATTDAAVAVAFNNSSMIRNRFFEQEFYDLERVEVLRGPQGTLYGRNATAGVVNIITAKPKFAYEAKASGDLANYNSTRIEGMVNIPLVEDKVALRLAGAWTKRNGYATNQITGNAIDGRDLWSTRLSLRFAPTAAIDANLIWEHFEEDDDRLRSGKQMCKRDDRTEIGGIPRPSIIGYSALYSQGCLPTSLYAPESFQAPDGFSLPYYHPLGQLWLPTIQGFDPYLSTTQSRDLRVIESTVDPQYRAKNDVAQLRFDIDLTDALTLTSETAYSADTLFSMQDYNRFNTAPGAFRDYTSTVTRQGILTPGPNGNVFCDPQIGCADRLVAIDLSTAESRQFSQELRLSSNYDGKLNFSLGANFLRYDTEDKYYVFINTLTLYSVIGNDPTANSWPNGLAEPWVPGVSDNSGCLYRKGPAAPDFSVPQSVTGCIYIDPNPIGSLNDKGHNYFLSRNPYKLISYAAFGELYYNIADNVKLTAGLRWTVDKKEAPRIPSWLLAADTVGYPVAETISQEWREPTGRLTLDWKPDAALTDDTLLYASYAHGYKAGGANPPAAGVVTYCVGCGTGDPDYRLVEQSATKPKTFDPEFVDAFEIGTKNTLLDGHLTLNAGAFFYDYQGYQISYIVDRSAVNLNFDARIWGLELEADWRPIENLRLGFKGGYENTRVADGMKAIDVMDRTAGNPDWLVVRPFPSYPNNCILPLYTAVGTGEELTTTGFKNGNPGPCEFAWAAGLDPVTNAPYQPDHVILPSAHGLGFYYPNYPGFDPTAYPEANNGEGFYKDLGGKKLPNAPKFTGTLTADYTIPMPGDWLATLHGDLHYQSESWARIFNTEGYDKLKAITNLNLAAVFTNDDAGWKVMAYVKNVFDNDAITGAFLNSDDTGLTTNVFLTEPRLYGLRVTKEWTGGSLFGDGFRRSEGPYPFTLELGGEVQRFDAPTGQAKPSFMNSFSDALDPRGDKDFDLGLDHGDGREVKLTYAPGGDWSVSLGARFGRTNGSDDAFRSEPGDTGCIGLKYAPPNYCAMHPTAIYQSTNWSQSDAYRHEEYKVVDFSVGREVGFGGLDTLRLNAGLRYAELTAFETVATSGIPEWDVPNGDFFTSPIKAVRYTHSAHIDHTFEGAGPMITWDASKVLFGDGNAGRVAVDWSITGGALFGTQKTSIQGEEKTEHLAGAGNMTTQVTPVDIQRSDSVTVPTVGAALGLSYKIDRLAVGAGYRWERYFDAIDGGYNETQQFDRTIDGPYFKIAVGFGG
jgi:outer membrane receptor protein involved in Fe transport